MYVYHDTFISAMTIFLLTLTCAFLWVTAVGSFIVFSVLDFVKDLIQNGWERDSSNIYYCWNLHKFSIFFSSLVKISNTKNWRKVFGIREIMGKAELLCLLSKHTPFISIFAWKFHPFVEHIVWGLVYVCSTKSAQLVFRKLQP